ncbi:MAG: hypothetical protein ACLR71_15815 [[Clostridium] scindens]
MIGSLAPCTMDRVWATLHHPPKEVSARDRTKQASADRGETHSRGIPLVISRDGRSRRENRK